MTLVDGHFHCRIDYAKRGGKKLCARAKHDYNHRFGRWANKHEGPLAFAESGNMPAWADDPRSFWEAADRLERGNGTFYFNAELAIPVELSTLKQKRAVMCEYREKLIGEKHPYSLTMHDNKGNPHCDLMWSTRTLDGIQRSSPEHFFKQAMKDPARGGCRKAEYNREWIVAARKLWEEVCNKHLEAAGSNVRIDHRSYKDRGIEKAPGVHLGRKVFRLEKAGKSTWRGNKNREAQYLNASLQEVQAQIAQHQKKQSAGEIHTLDAAKRQAYKAMLLERQYKQKIEAELAANLSYVYCKEDHLSISLKGGWRVNDHGDYLSTRSGSDMEITSAITLAQTKGWRQIQITGTKAFKARAYVEAVRAGLTVVGYEPSPELRAQLEKEKPMTDQAGAGGMMALTPDATIRQRWETALQRALVENEERRKAGRASELFQLDQEKKALVRWLETCRHRHIDDLMWEVAHHQAENKKVSAALAPFYQMHAADAEAIKRAREVERQAQVRRELEAQKIAERIETQLAKPGLSAGRVDELEQQHRYYLAIADGHTEQEAKERAAHPKTNALRR